jgi:hypothetical protein
MKPQHNRNSHNGRDAALTQLRDPSLSQRGMDAENFRVLPMPPPRRYPSLSDDFQPRIRRSPRTRSPAARAKVSTRISAPVDRSRSLHVRLIALLAIIVIIAALAASASPV